MSKFKIIAFLVLGFIVYKVFFAVKDFEVGLDKRIKKVEALGLSQEDEVIGLMMYLGDPEDLVLVEHFLVKNRSKCLEMKKNAKEVSNAYYECAKLNATVKEGKIITVIEKLEVL
jgi:hypothetical protein